MQTQGQGHETTFAQTVAEELGIPPEDIDVIHGETDNAPYGLGTYGSRSMPVNGAATALAARKVRDKARIVASAMLEVAADDLEWEKVRRFVAVDDCGTRINPMIIEGQVPGGLTDGVGMALMELIAFDEDGSCLGGSLMVI